MAKSLVGVKDGEYKGNQMVVIDPETRYPFQFGAGKCVMLLLACAVNGIGPMFDKLLECAGDKLDKTSENVKGLTKAQVKTLRAELAKLDAPVAPAATKVPSKSKSPRSRSTKTSTADQEGEKTKAA